MGFFDFFKKKKKANAEEPKAAPAKEQPKAAAKAEAAAAPAPAAGKSGFTPYPAADLGELLPPAPAGGKIKIAIYWTAGCGGCDVSILDTNERVLTIAQFADIVMWPVAVDGKEKDIEALDDGAITVSLINGAIRNSENEHMAKLLRKKSVLVVAYGTCAMFGGSPALANLVPGGASEILDYVYTKTPTSAAFQERYHADAAVVPKTVIEVPEGTLTLPVVYDTVKTLDQVIDVDYYIPGCPPQQESISHLLKAVVDFVYNGVALPPKGAEIGVTEKCLCDECPRTKEYARITKIYEPYQVNVDPEKCLMDQGILCLGPATVGGCNAKCTKVGQPCRGCYGPTRLVQEHGASALTAIASLFPVLDDDPTCDEDQIIEIMKTVKDPLGYFYAYTLGKSLIKRTVVEEN
ncbi:MAG: oxidoreductase [Candidatus Methanomethylophilus sp.]|nr:oxidoreductase [Methanomethylophilus sp.]